MSSPDLTERQRSSVPAPDAESHEGGMSMSPPAFQLFADGGGDGSNTSPMQLQAAPVAQLQGEYHQFPDSLNIVLGARDATPGPGDPGHPGTHYEYVPESCYLVLWDVFKAIHWQEGFGRSAAGWARMAVDRLRSMQGELNTNGVIAAPLITQLSTAMAPIINPTSGSAAAAGLEGVFVSVLDNHHITGPLSRTQQSKQDFANKMRSTLVAAANILSDELSASVPAQIFNAEGPYNFLHYNGLLSDSMLRGVTALFRARWEASRQSTRREKISYARNAFNRANLFNEGKQREMLQAITSLDEAGITTELTRLRDAIQTHVLARMDAVNSDAELTPIARNGLEHRERPRTARRGGGGRRTVEPIVYEDGVPAVAWSPTSTTTNLTTREELGDDPRRSLHGANIGAWAGGYYPVVYGGREYRIIVRTEGRPYFGIKYGGRSSMTLSAIDDLLTRPYFSDAQRMVIRASIPQVASEGGISSINTWDKQDITIAGRGERSNRVSLLVQAAQALMAQYEPETDVSGLTEVATLISKTSGLARTSAEGTAGPDGVRFDLPNIHRLVELLETPAIHRAMTFAKMNDSLLGFFSAPYERRGTATRFDRDLNRDDERRLETEVGSNHLHPAIMGVAMHHRLGAPAYFSDPMGYSIQANRAFPQRAAYVGAGLPDYEQLSKQVAYLGKIRIQNWRNSRGRELGIATATLNAMFSQKVTDFDNYFRDNGAEPENGGYFNYSAAQSVLGFWTGRRSFEGSQSQPAAGNLYFTQGERSAKRYFDCGTAINSTVEAPVVDTSEEGTEMETE